MDAVWLLHSAVLTSCYPAQCPWLFWVLVLESLITDGLQCFMEVEGKACILFLLLLFLDCKIFLSCKLSVFVNVSTLFSFPPLGRVLLCSLGWPYTWLSSFLGCSSAGALDILYSSRSPFLLFSLCSCSQRSSYGDSGKQSLATLDITPWRPVFYTQRAVSGHSISQPLWAEYILEHCLGSCAKWTVLPVHWQQERVSLPTLTHADRSRWRDAYVPGHTPLNCSLKPIIEIMLNIDGYNI